MENTRQSITFKVVIGYLLFAALAVLAVWFVYSQVRSYTDMAEASISSNQKLYLVGEAATNLYEAESLSRQLIQSGSTQDLDSYTEKIEEIQQSLVSLNNTYSDSFLREEIDSINSLLSQKTSNLRELLEIREQAGNESYYMRVLTELQRMNGNFAESDYDTRFPNLEPHQRQLLAKIMEFSTPESPTPVSTETVDSLVNSVKNVLIDFEAADRRYRQTLRNKENQLLASEVEINSQLRNLLSAIEEEERETSLAQVAQSQEMVQETSQTIAIIGAISFLVILIFLFLVIRDVSRSQRYRMELEEAKQYAETLLKSREQFMATLTHDLRSPLNTVEGYTDLLQNTGLTHTQSQYLKLLKKSSNYILRLVNEMLDLAKLEAGKMNIEILPFNPKNLIEDTVESAVPAQKPEAVQIVVEVGEDLDKNVRSDPFRIKQILTNLVTNAVKFTDQGQVKISASLDNSSIESQLVISVKDTGIGISEEKKEGIFEEFSQEDSSIEKRFGGSGLGLAISKKLTELLGGTIEVFSELGKGSEFIVRIPIEKASPSSADQSSLLNSKDAAGAEFSPQGKSTAETDKKPDLTDEGELQEIQARASSPTALERDATDKFPKEPGDPKEEETFQGSFAARLRGGQPPKTQPQQKRILIVDDEPAQLGLISELIKSTGLSFETSNNGLEALEKLKESRFDLVLTDIQMPTMDGFELLKAIKEQPETQGIPVVALSGKADISTGEYLKKGFTGSLLKPYSSKKLLGLIEQALDLELWNSHSPGNPQPAATGHYSLEEVRLFAGGDENALKSILETFIDSTLQNLDFLQHAMDQGEKKEIQRIAHKMLPMFRQLKANLIVQQLEFLENTEPEKIQAKHLQVLRKEIEGLIKNLRSEIDSGNTDGP